jgi:hypothetical protein
MRPVLLLIVTLAALLAALAATAVLTGLPPVRSVTQPGEFDATRAKARLATILGDEPPHPADSSASDAVRSRLIGQIRALGLNPIVRDQFACNELYKQRGVACARVRNVIVAPGPTSGRALLLNTHYDSNPSGPGAGDAGAGVATLLEVASILKAERLTHPVILLFNEGEELGLVGARAFLSDPLSKRVDSLINLEARGTTGPVSMFETSLPNGAPVRAFARAVDRPFANSLATDFYRQLPNYTDVNSFSERGWVTLNFAMVGNETRYHSAGDNLAALDPRSLQHMGDQALAVARELGPAPQGSGSVLFADFAGRQLIVVPEWLGLGLFALLVAGFAVASWRRGGLWRGLALFLAALLGSAALAFAGMYAMGLLRDGSFWRGYPIWTHAAVYASALVATVAALALLGRRLTVAQLRATFWLGFLLVGVAVLFIAPGGLIYFLFAPLLALLGFFLSRWIPWAERAGSIAAAVILWLTLGEVVALLTELLVNGPMFVFAPLAVMLAMPWLIEARSLVEETGRSRAIGASALLALLGWGAVAAAPAYSADRQQRFAIQFVSDSGKSWWAVDNDGAPLPQAFGRGWLRDELPHSTAKLWVRPAPDLRGTVSPAVEVVGRARSSNGREISLRLRSNGNDRVVLIAPKDAEILAAGTGDYVRPISAEAKKGRYLISCTGRSCDGAELTLVTSSASPIELLVAGIRYALPRQAQPLVSARPANARPQYSPDQSIAMVRVRV